MTEDTKTIAAQGGEKEKLFSHEQLERIVEQRLSRERKNFENLEKVRNLLSALRKKEPFKKLSNASMVEKLARLLSEKNDAEQGDFAQSDNRAIPDANTCESRPNAQSAENESAPKIFDPGERRKRELSEFLAAYGEEKLTDVLSDPAFKAFSRARYGDLLSIYEEYCGFLSELSSSPEAKRYRAAQRELASTGFSGGASCATDYGSLLSENQKRIAKAAGMSYRQYSELLSQIPTKRL